MNEPRGKFVLNERIPSERLTRFLHYLGQGKIKNVDPGKLETEKLDSYVAEFDEKLSDGLVSHKYLGRVNPNVFNIPYVDSYVPFYQLLQAADDALLRMYRLFSLKRLTEDEMQTYRYEITSTLDRAQRTFLG